MDGIKKVFYIGSSEMFGRNYITKVSIYGYLPVRKIFDLGISFLNFFGTFY